MYIFICTNPVLQRQVRFGSGRSASVLNAISSSQSSQIAEERPTDRTPLHHRLTDQKAPIGAQPDHRGGSGVPRPPHRGLSRPGTPLFGPPRGLNRHGADFPREYEKSGRTIALRSSKYEILRPQILQIKTYPLSIPGLVPDFKRGQELRSPGLRLQPCQGLVLSLDVW